MTENEMDRLFQEFSKITDPVERAKLSYVAYGRIAAGQENKESGYEKLGMTMGENWLAAATRFEKMLTSDPDKAFEIAVQLTTLPISNNRKVEDTNKWLRGDGPGMLGREELRSRLIGFLSDKDKPAKLLRKLEEHLSYDFTQVADPETAFEDPNCYLSLATILLGMKMGSGSNIPVNAKDIAEEALEKLTDSDTRRVIGYYEDLPDTKWLADELKSFVK